MEKGIVSKPPRTLGPSFCPASHGARPFTEDARLRIQSDQTPSDAILRSAASSKLQECGKLLHTSLSLSDKEVRDIIPQRNGFVDTVLEAYNNHRGLIIRPDDVWLAIMLQFSFFVNGNSEALRHVFVAHEGKRDLEIHTTGNRYTLDMPTIVQCMTELMEEHIVDPALREWIMPDFTTTTPVDRSTCAIVMMGMMKDYFSYSIYCICGIPRVTLEGEKKDWENILERIERLKKYGIQTIAWYHLLRPILARFVAAYDKPSRKFWGKIVSYEWEGSGSKLLTGWITAFCVFSEKGKWQGYPLNEEPGHQENKPKKLTAAQFAAAYVRAGNAPHLVVDGFPYPTIDIAEVPCGYASADVKLSDEIGDTETMLIAGHVGAQMCSRPATAALPQSEQKDTVRPFSGWWYYVKQKSGEGDANSNRGRGSPDIDV